MTDTQKPKSTRRCARTPNSAASAEDNAKAGKDTGPVSAPPEEAAAKVQSKIGRVVALLERAEGATLEEMVAATGWLPHTTRAALTGLKKKGHTIIRDKRGDMSCYRIGQSA